MRAEVRSGEQLATRSPARCFGPSAKAQLHFGRRNVKIFFFLTCKRMAGRSSVLPNEIQRERARGETATGVASYRPGEGLRLLCDFNLFTPELE